MKEVQDVLQISQRIAIQTVREPFVRLALVDYVTNYQAINMLAVN